MKSTCRLGCVFTTGLVRHTYDVAFALSMKLCRQAAATHFLQLLEYFKRGVNKSQKRDRLAHFSFHLAVCKCIEDCGMVVRKGVD